MLIPLSLQLARAVRRRRPLVFAEVDGVELAVAALRAAEARERPLVLSVDATHPLLYSLEFLVGSLLQLGRLSHTEVTVEVLTGPHHVAVEQALVAGAQAVTPLPIGISATQLRALLGWTVSRAAAQGREAVAFLGRLPRDGQGLQDAAALVRESGAVAVRVPLLAGGPPAHLNAEACQDLAKAVRVPLVALPETWNARQLRRLAALRVAGVVMGPELEEGFTGGLRAALHDRDRSSLRSYLPAARTAVESTLARYLDLLCST